MKAGTPDPERAKMYAEVKHSGQTYNDEVPYTYHLQAVVDVLKRFNVYSNAMICAGYLHDSLEDTSASYSDIKERFGEEVAELVYAVTSERGRNRKERNEKTYPKIKGRVFETILKLADRIANVEYGSATGGKVDMYRKEFLDFEAGIRDIALEQQNERTGISYNGYLLADPTPRMWNHLKTLLK